MDAFNQKALVIVPTFNEKENLELLVARINAVKVSVDILVVDDNSPDGTGRLADSLAQKHPFLKVIHRREKSGLGRAYLEGFQWALDRDYDRICEMDGDLSHDPNDLPKLLKAADEADMVLGSRYMKGIRVINWPLNRLLLSLSAAKYVQSITGMPFSDPTGGFKCFRRSALEKIDLSEVHSNGYSFQIEMTHRIWRLGLTINEIPIIFTDRYLGTSKMSPEIVREALWITWRLLIQNRFSRSPGVPASKPISPSSTVKPSDPSNSIHAG